MTEIQFGVVCLAAVCAVLGLALARLSGRLRETAARSAAELEALRRELSGLEQGRTSLERLSATDPVTGVWNHRYLQETLAFEVDRSRRIERPFAVLMCDVDCFRAVNARHGHQAGSAILRQLAQRLALEIRSIDTFARYGGEEFVVLLPDTGADGAAVVAERLCYAARKLVLQVSDTSSAVRGEAANTMRLTVSVGAALFPENGTHGATLLRCADEALARVKRAGGDTWHLAEVGDTDATQHAAARSAD